MTRLLLLLLSGCLLMQTANACLWDSDTLDEERRAFPGTIELIVGYFPRHSTAFYQWRIEDRAARLAAAPHDLDLRDDLAVAYEKTGQTEKAIDLMLGSLEQAPERYETQANLGTFYIHNGQYQKGLEHIKRAIEINPDAHFGREIYQQYLVEYLLEKGIDTRPLSREDRSYGSTGFAHYAMERAEEHTNNLDYRAELAAALKGVQGMMRFSNHESPVLLEALGDLLLANLEYQQHTHQLAAAAYLQASLNVEDPEVSADYRRLAEQALYKHKDVSLDQLEAALLQANETAAAWYADLEAKEAAWIINGDDPEAKYNAFPSPPALTLPADLSRTSSQGSAATWATTTGFVVLLLIFAFFIWHRRRRRVQAMA